MTNVWWKKTVKITLVIFLFGASIIGSMQVNPTVISIPSVSSEFSDSGNPSPFANISDNPAYFDNFTLSAAFEMKMQVTDGGIDESEDIHYINTDNTLEAIWIWSRYYTLTRNHTYYSNITRAWNYSVMHPAWREGDSGKIYSCAWALMAELEYRLAFDDDTYLWYAQLCADFISRNSGWEPNLIIADWGRNHIRGMAAGTLYDWALDQNDDFLRKRAVALGNWTMVNITANSSWLTSEAWALAGGVAYWGIVHSTFREYPNLTWAKQYGAMLKTNITTPGVGPGNSQCGWYAWYALGHYAAWEATGNTTYLNQSLGMIAWLIIQDGDRDGGIPTNFGDPDDEDESWVTSYRALNLGCILTSWLGQPPDPPTITSASLTGLMMENMTLTWRPSLQESVIGDVVRYDIYRNSINNTYDTTGTNYSWIASVPAGAGTFTDVNVGTDWRRFFYFVKSVDSEWLVSSGSNQAAKLVEFYSGYTGKLLYTNPLIMENYSIESVMRDMTIDYVRVFNTSDSTSPWKSYMSGRIHQDIIELLPGTGFWTSIVAGRGVRMVGLVSKNITLNLRAGWNLIGYCSMENRTVAETLTGIPWLRVEVFEPVRPFNLRTAMPDEILRTGQGMWVLVSSDSTLVYTN